MDLVAMLIVLAAEEHVGLLRLRQFAHDHDFVLPISRRIGSLPGRHQRFQMLLPLCVRPGEIVGKQLIAFFGLACLIRGKRSNSLQRRKLAREDAEVVDQPVREAVVAET